MFFLLRRKRERKGKWNYVATLVSLIADEHIYKSDRMEAKSFQNWAFARIFLCVRKRDSEKRDSGGEEHRRTCATHLDEPSDRFGVFISSSSIFCSENFFFGTENKSVNIHRAKRNLDEDSEWDWWTVSCINSPRVAFNRPEVKISDNGILFCDLASQEFHEQLFQPRNKLRLFLVCTYSQKVPFVQTRSGSCLKFSSLISQLETQFRGISISVLVYPKQFRGSLENICSSVFIAR